MTFSTKASTKVSFVLESLDVHSFAGIESAHFAPSTTGVTVVHGSNEAGKSSLMNAFSLLLSDWKVSTTSKKVSGFFPVGKGTKPKITARMQLGENLVEYTKDFENKKVLLDVLQPSVHNYTGDQAMEKFNELLNESIDSALREALFVSQGQRLDALDFTAIPSLSSALRTAGDGAVDDSPSAAGGISEGDQGAAELLVRLIDEEDKKLRDRRANRNSKGELVAAEADLVRAQEALATAKLEYNDAQAAIREIESKQIQRADAEDDLPDAQKEFDECAERLEAAKKVAETLSSLEKELELKKDQVGRWQEATEAREKQKLAQRELEQSLKTAMEELRGVQKKAEEQQTERDEAKKAFDSAHAAYVRADKRAKLATALKNAAEVQGRLESAADERDGAVKLDAKVAELAQKVDRNPATPKAEQRIREAMTDLDAQIKIRDAGATSVHITGPAGGTVVDDGEEATLGENGLEKKVTTEWTVGLGEYEVRVTPAQDSSNLDLNVDEALQKVNAELSAVGLEPIALEDPRVEVLEEFGRAVRARNEDEETLRDQRASLKAVLGKRTLSDLNGQVESLTAEVERLRETCSALRSDANVEAGENIDESIDEAEAATALEVATRARDEANEKLLSLQNSDAIERKIQHEAKVDNLHQQLDAAAKDLEAARERYSDEDLNAKHTQAVQAVDVAREKLDSKRWEVGELGDVEDVQASLEGARSRVNMLNQQVQECRVDIAALNAKLGQARGSAENREQAEAEVERLEGVVARLRRQADSAELLHRVVQAARRRMQEKYSEPYRKALNKLSGIVFGSDVDLDVDEKFQVSSRAIGNVRLDKEQLSGGAQEQVEILQLLAIARLVGHDGSGVPIFLDDVLGFSDTDRAKSMNKVLGALGRDNQIIVLTCDKDRFSRIPGVNFQSIDSVKKTGASS